MGPGGRGVLWFKNWGYSRGSRGVRLSSPLVPETLGLGSIYLLYISITIYSYHSYNTWLVELRSTIEKDVTSIFPYPNSFFLLSGHMLISI